ncbi:AraC-like DNA-binding protein [Paenibacillus shirakamiensis]|uniref:AraC-like DNA-binding protein n=1 Tax=Paenibacillus shirakamiensis TaxID=1265935 RepID=A0ABS4JDM0_9BACL|nr:AraC-like DNA-binding protein [Paenibacillus shirakamiensis]
MQPETYVAAANPAPSIDSPVQVLFCGASQTRPNHLLGPKVVDYYLLHLIEEGQGTFTNEWTSYSLSAGDGFLIHPEQLISYGSHSENPWRYRWIAFTGIGASSIVAEAGFDLHHPVIHACNVEKFSQHFINVLAAFQQRQGHAHLLSLGHLYMLLAEAEDTLKETAIPLESESGLQYIVKQMIQTMTSQYAYPVSIEEMSKSMGYNRAYLSRIFKKQIGVSPVTYLLRLRMDKARLLLRERPDLSTQQIAASVGMPDALYFSRQFSRLHGRPPSSYRKMTAGDLNGSALIQDSEH